MGRRPTRGKCVHCLTEDVERTWDHVLPVSYYPDTTPRNLEKWNVPVCERCNRELGQVEEELLRPIAACLDPFHPASASVVEKNLRGMHMQAGRDDRDRRIRDANRRRFLESVLTGEEIPIEGVYPGLGERWGRPVDEQMAVVIPRGHLRRLVEKIVRGVFHRLDEKFIEPPFSIRFFAVEDERARPVREMLDKFGRTYHQGPGFTVRRAVAVEDGLSSVFSIELWGGQMTLYAVVSTDDQEGRGRPSEEDA